jgi:hypothetical protein
MKRMRKDTDEIVGAWLLYMGMGALGLSLLVFLLYVSGILSSHIRPGLSAGTWIESTQNYLKVLGVEPGALWMFRSLDGYSVSTAALALLASTALPALTALAVVWLKRRDWLYGFMSLAISGVLIAAILG